MFRVYALGRRFIKLQHWSLQQDPILVDKMEFRAPAFDFHSGDPPVFQNEKFYAQ